MQFEICLLITVRYRFEFMYLCHPRRCKPGGAAGRRGGRGYLWNFEKLHSSNTTRARISSPRPHPQPQGSSSRVLTRHPSDDPMIIRRPITNLRNRLQILCSTSVVGSLLMKLRTTGDIYRRERREKKNN